MTQVPAKQLNPSQRIATIDWRRQLVMVLMVIDPYPMCRWYRTVRRARPSSFVKYL
jgi:hypothetical protein